MFAQVDGGPQRRDGGRRSPGARLGWLVALASGFIFVLVSAVWAAPDQVEVAVGDKGLTTLRYGGREFLQNGEFRVAGAFFMKDGAVRAADLAGGQLRRTDGPTPTLTWNFPWGRVALRCEAAGNRLRLTVDLAVNRDAGTLVGIYLHLADLKFPKKPDFQNESFFFYGWTTIGHNVGGPSVVGADFGSGVLVLANEDSKRPLAFGLGQPSDGNAATVYPILAYTSRHPMLKKTFPFIDRPIPPGGTDRYILSLRFGPAGTKADDLAEDIYKSYAAAFPPRFKWPDRRPIGRFFMSTSEARCHSKTNPRGWFMDPTLDVISDAGRAKFKERVLAWADSSIKICKEMDAQGIVVWDSEGQEYPHATSYLGDPRRVAPEFEPFSDEFYNRFLKAGLRTGVCIRPQRLVETDKGLKQEGVSGHKDRVALVTEKIQFARKRWGCTLFYFDSNVDWPGDPVSIPGAAGSSVTIDSLLLKELMEKFPDVMIIPEWQTAESYAYSAPYNQLDVRLKLTAPPPSVLRSYPGAFFVNMVTGRDADAHRDALIKAVRRGDILFFDGWWPAPDNARVKAIYEAAAAAP
jgi:hypothetical protein